MWGIVGVVMLLITAFCAGCYVSTETWQKKSIDKGYAVYCPYEHGGAWAWKADCVEKLPEFQ